MRLADSRSAPDPATRSFAILRQCLEQTDQGLVAGRQKTCEHGMVVKPQWQRQLAHRIGPVSVRPLGRLVAEFDRHLGMFP